jgi:hypothetical protein
MKLGVIGSRSFDDYELLKREINKLDDVECIVSGGANEADKLSELYAREFNVKTEIYYPDLSKGKYAVLAINNDIVKSSDMLLCFWDGESKDTLYTINLARKQNKKVVVINFAPGR